MEGDDTTTTTKKKRESIAAAVEPEAAEAEDDPQAEPPLKKLKLSLQGEAEEEEAWGEVLERTRRASAIALPGLTDDASDQCERDYERAYELDEGTIRLPQRLRELYRAFSGLNVTGDDLWIFGFNVLPLQPVDVVSPDDRRNRRCPAPRSVQQYRDDIIPLLDDWPEEERATSVCDPRWLVLGVISEYYNVAINACPADEANYGKVRMLVLNDPSEAPVADGIEEFWRQLVVPFVEAKLVHQQIEALDPGGLHRVFGFELCRETAQHCLAQLRDDLARLQDAKKHETAGSHQ